MGRYAVINEKNIVVNVIEWNGEVWSPPIGCALIAAEGFNIGNIFVKPANDATPPSIAAIPDVNYWQQFTGAARLGEKI